MRVMLPIHYFLKSDSFIIVFTSYFSFSLFCNNYLELPNYKTSKLFFIKVSSLIGTSLSIYLESSNFDSKEFCT